MADRKKRVVSGIRTSGELHLGNYLGALRQFIDLQDAYECYFFLADLHALTTPYDPKTYRRTVLRTANAYLACGLDPEKIILFRQSDVPAHAELSWLLDTIATMGELGRMTQFKDKAGGQKRDSVNVGLFNYPVLMAADILLYQPDLVPVGEDQKQHVELTRDLGGRFNRRFGRAFRVPKPLIQRETARIKGLDDPTKKMSKTAPSELSYLALSDPPDVVRDKIRRAVTDSGSDIAAGSKKPALTNLLTIFSQLDGTSVAKLESRYRGRTYQEFKADLADVVIAALAPIQQSLAELEANPDYTETVLADGADRARSEAAKTMAAVRAAMGLA